MVCLWACYALGRWPRTYALPARLFRPLLGPQYVALLFWCSGGTFGFVGEVNVCGTETKKKAPGVSEIARRRARMAAGHRARDQKGKRV